MIILYGDFPLNSCQCLFVDESDVLYTYYSLEEKEGYSVDIPDFSSVGNPRVRKHFPETWIWLDTNMG